MDLIEPNIRPFLGNSKGNPSENILRAISLGEEAGPAYETLGQQQAALDCYQLGQYDYREDSQVYAVDQGKEEIPLMGRDDAARQQLVAAVCADRVGNANRANQLYAWAVENRRLTPEEVEHFRESQPQAIWSRLPYQAYALACLERWEKALKVAEQCQVVVSEDQRAQTSESYQDPLQLLDVISALVRYKVNPTEEHRREAREKLDPQSVATRVHSSHLYSLFYLYNLRERHPELVHPESSELPDAERARQGAEACVKWMREDGLKLDYSPESLKALDKRICKMYRALHGEEKRRWALFLWGCYLGEVVRRELPGGQWQFSTESLLDSTLYWDMGEIEFEMYPFGHLHQYLRGEEDKTLFQAWQETERAYVGYGQAARRGD